MKLVVLALLAAAPVLAEGGPSQESIERLKQAIRAAGCTVTEVNQPTVLAEAEMDETEAGVIASWLVEQGEAELDESTLHLTAGACAEPASTPRAIRPMTPLRPHSDPGHMPCCAA